MAASLIFATVAILILYETLPLFGVFHASTFIGDWLNVRYNGKDTDLYLLSISIDENEGTYAISTYLFWNYPYPQDNPCGGTALKCGDWHWGPTILTVTPPTAHAFFISKMVDLQLRLRNSTFLEIRESIPYTLIRTEFFVKVHDYAGGFG